VRKEKIVIGSRASKLALIQSNWTKSELETRFSGLDVIIKEISTKGDRITDVPLSRLGGVGLFTKELENSLLSGEIDIAVHSAKDMPSELPEGLAIGAFPKREDSHDVFIGREGVSLDQISADCVIGTSSLRRKAQLLARFPDLKIEDLRGNLDTRLEKLKNGNFDGIILANAGLIRMGLGEIARQIIPFDFMLPAVGQGSLAIETRQDDDDTLSMVSLLNDRTTRIAVTAERSLLHKLQGGCQIPVGAAGEVCADGQLRLTAMVSSLDGTEIVKESAEGDVENASSIGLELAELLLGKGADKILREIRESLAQSS